MHETNSSCVCLGNVNNQVALSAPNTENPNSGANMLKHCAFCEESPKLTGCVDIDTSMNIRYRATCEIDTESEKFEISDILI